MSHHRSSSVGRPSSRRHGVLTAKMHARHFVVHDYIDHATYTADMVEAAPRKGRRGGVITPFPQKLHQVLEQVEHDGFADCISWQPHGRCFMIHKPKDFVAQVMPKYFNQTKLTSFQRQLNLYGFQRLTKGPDANGYYHSCFLRGKPFLTAKMVRTRIKGTKVKGASNPEQEPDFYAMPSLRTTTQGPVVTSDEDEATVSSQSTFQYDTTYHAQELPQLLPPIQKEEVTSRVYASSSSSSGAVKKDSSSTVTNNKDTVVPILLPKLSTTPDHHSMLFDVGVTTGLFSSTSDKEESGESSHFDPNSVPAEVPVPPEPSFHDITNNDDPVDAMIMEFRQENLSTMATTTTWTRRKGNSAITSTSCRLDDETLGHFLDAMMNDPIFDCFEEKN